MNDQYKTIVTEFYSASMGLKKISDFYIFKHGNDYGVAIDNINKIEIDEMFANVHLRSVVIPNIDDKVIGLIVMTSTLSTHKKEFASFCIQFLDNRVTIEKTPLLWWNNLRELIGNKFSEVGVYDVIAELLTIEKISDLEKDIVWKGPSGSSIDIETSDNYYEVKSSKVRYENEVTVSSQFQLSDYKKPTFLIYYKMEELLNGETINIIMKRLDKSGIINTEEIEEKLSRLGFRKNSSIRNKSYVVHEVRKYEINDDFPRLTLNSFIDKKIPNNIKKITYTISLDGINYINWER